MIVTPDDSLLVVSDSSGLSASVDDHGRLRDISVRGSRVRVDDGWAIRVDGRVLSPDDLEPAGTRLDRDAARGDVCLESLGRVRVIVSYRAVRGWIERSLKVTGAEGAWLDSVHFRTAARWEAVESFEVRTFSEAPFAAAQRSRALSLLAGLQNPYTVSKVDEALDFQYRPALNLGESGDFVSDAQVISLVPRSRALIREVVPRTRVGAAEPRNRARYRNPSGRHPLDTAEIAAFQSIVRRFLEPLDGRLRFILYTFWTPLPHIPTTEQDAKLWRRTIDNFADLGGDMLLTVPLVEATVPTADPNSYWDLEPEGSMAAKLMGYARSLGLGVGYYMGVAGGNLPYGNVPGLGLPLDGPRSWRKVNEDGSVARENCLACGEYRQWWERVQANTIRRFGLQAWSWDPGPGNGRFCYSTEHGHRPGMGEHKGWQEGQRLIADLRAEFPDLFLQGFYGQKEDGTWGQRGVSEHEHMWEQEAETGSVVYPDLSAGRLNGGGLRMQAWWSQNFRFLPAETNHALLGRMTQVCLEDPALLDAFDSWGWRYSLLSAVAVGGSPEASTLPPMDAGEEVRSEYRRWIAWAKETSGSLATDVAGGAQVEVGHLDWHFRYDDDHAWLIAGNPAPRPVSEIVELPSSAYRKRRRLQLRHRWPEPGKVSTLADGRQSFDAEHPALIEVPPLTVSVFEIEEAGSRVVDPVTLPSAEASAVVPLDSWTAAVDPWEGLLPSRIRTVLQVPGIFSEHDAGEVLRKRLPLTPDTFADVDPRRVTLIVPLRDPGKAGHLSLRVDDEFVELRLFEYTKAQRYRPMMDHRPENITVWDDMPVAWWADLTDALRDGAIHRIELSLPGVAPENFVGPWLQVPSASAVETTHHGSGGAPVTWPSELKPVTTPAREGPAVVAAAMVPPVLHRNCEFTIEARTAPGADVESVFVSLHVGEGNVFDRRLAPDAADPTRWMVTSRVFDRAGIILDPGKFTVWAVDHQGAMGPDTRIPVRWQLEAL